MLRQLNRTSFRSVLTSLSLLTRFTGIPVDGVGDARYDNANDSTGDLSTLVVFIN